MIRATDVGWRAQETLARTTAPLRVLAVLSGSMYLAAAETVLWLGPTGSVLHPRAILTPDFSPSRSPLEIDLRLARAWRPPVLPAHSDTAEHLRGAARVLAGAIAQLGAPEGFGALLVGRRPPFPLDVAVPKAAALAQACAADDPAAARAAACTLLGLGPGLTPAGDDFVGGAFFARAQLAPWAGNEAKRWRRAAAAVRRAARQRTSRISAALLDDLLDGAGYAPLHDLTAALAERRPPGDVADAVRRLVRVGHSSGSDLLAGFVAGLGALDTLVQGRPAPSWRRRPGGRPRLGPELDRLPDRRRRAPDQTAGGEHLS